MNDATWNNFDHYEAGTDENKSGHLYRMYANFASVVMPAICLIAEAMINKLWYPIGLGYFQIAYVCLYLALNFLIYKA